MIFEGFLLVFYSCQCGFGGQTSMEDRNRSFYVSYIKNTICFRSVTLVVEDNCGLSAPSHFRKAMEVGTGCVRHCLSKPGLLQKPEALLLKSIDTEIPI